MPEFLKHPPEVRTDAPKEWVIVVTKTGDLEVTTRDIAQTMTDARIDRLVSNKDEGDLYIEKEKYSNLERPIFGDIAKELSVLAGLSLPKDLLSSVRKLHEKFNEASWHLSTHRQKDAAIRSLKTLADEISVDHPAVGSALKERIAQFWELEKSITTRRTFELHDNANVDVAVRGFIDNEPECDITLRKIDGSGDVSLTSFGVEEISLILMRGDNPTFSVDIKTGQVNFSIGALNNLPKYLFTILHEIGHTHQIEMRRERDSSTGIRTTEILSQMERNAWARAYVSARALMKDGFDISVPMGGLEKLKEEVRYSLGTYEKHSCDPEAKGLFINGRRDVEVQGSDVESPGQS